MANLELVREDGERVRVDSFKRSVYFKGKEASFTEMEWILLKGLYFKLGEVVKRSFLLSLLKEEKHRDNTRIVDVHVSSIRKKLEKIHVARIVSAYGLGYVLKMSKNK